MSRREAYERKLEAQMKEWKAEISKLQAKAEQAKAESRLQYLNQVESLKEKQRAAQDRLDALKKASEASWEDVKSSVEKAWNELGDAVKTIRDNFRNAA